MLNAIKVETGCSTAFVLVVVNPLSNNLIEGISLLALLLIFNTSLFCSVILRFSFSRNSEWFYEKVKMVKNRLAELQKKSGISPNQENGSAEAKVDPYMWTVKLFDNLSIGQTFSKWLSANISWKPLRLSCLLLY